MSFIRKWITAAAAVGALALASLPVKAAVTQLGFMLDGSGSVASSDYNLLRTGLANALASLPVDGTVEITIVAYGSGVDTVTPPTILTAASLPTIQAAINTHSKYGGGTATDAAIRSLTGLMTGSGVFSAPDTRSIMNLATDGVPNSQSAAVSAAADAFAAGIDAMGIEAIGSGVSSQSALNNMALIAFPDAVTILPVNSTNIPNPINGSFVVPVSNFSELDAVLLAKVQASVIDPNPVPEPGSMMLMAGALGVMVAISRRKCREGGHKLMLQAA